MTVITGLLIASLLHNVGMALSVEWTAFKKLNGFSTSPNKSLPLYTNNRDQIISCCMVCGGIPECKSVVVNNDHCICSSEIIPHSSQVDNHTSVYVKHKEFCYALNYTFVNNLCIRVSTVQKTWHEAKQDCEKTGGNLIVLDSMTKHQRVYDMFSRYDNNIATKYFVGASDIEQEGSWKWIKENSLSYMHDVRFTDNDIDYPGQGADCGAINLESNGIDDEFCDGLNYYICEVML